MPSRQQTVIDASGALQSFYCSLVGIHRLVYVLSMLSTVEDVMAILRSEVSFKPQVPYRFRKARSSIGKR